MPGGFHPPPSVIESWPEPNYVDPETKGKELLVISLILTILAIVFVGARLLVRGRIKKQLGWDDGLLALSLVCPAIFQIAGLYHFYLFHMHYDAEAYDSRLSQ